MSDDAPLRSLPPAPRRVGVRTAIVAATVLATAWSLRVLELEWADVVPGRDDLGQLADFAAAALRPALVHPDPLPGLDEPLWWIVVESLARTIGFASAGMSLAVLGGLALGFLGATAWWEEDPSAPGNGPASPIHRLGPLVYGATRILTALMRSVHELIWALLFLASFGLTDLSAVFAIAIPYAGTLAKVYSEALDEAPRATAEVLRGVGGGPAQAVALGLLPRALPDMAAYTLYRFECAVRSSAILGFFGWQTLGYHIRLEWGSADYREVWTFLYALLALVVALDLWSGGLRRRWVA